MASSSSSRKHKRSSETKPSAEEYKQSAISHVRKGSSLSRYVSKVGELCFVRDSDDEKHCKEIQRLLKAYILGDETRPLSIVVFGPPGSGKSTYVRGLIKAIGEEELPRTKKRKTTKETKSSKKKTFTEKMTRLFEVNLAQFHAPQELSEHFNSVPARTKKTKGFFFDEFDSSLEGVSLGWLRWFLAPMQDGKFFYNSKPKGIGKSIFIFAGGTASTLKEFEDRASIDSAAYHEKKVPDFISRLRAFVDITGINNPGDDRPVRRAIILHKKLAKKFSIEEEGPLPIEEKSTWNLLSNAHYIHGTRSMEALIEMSAWKKGEIFNTNTKGHLPAQHLMELHVSRGKLNGIRVGISAGLNESNKDFLVKLSGRLFENGADLAYGGNLGKDGKGSLAAMVTAAQDTPEDLLKRKERQRIRNYLGYPAYRDAELIDLNKKVEDQVRVCELETLSETECTDLSLFGKDYFPARPRNNLENYNPKQHLAWALSLFRMRVHMIRDLSALIVFGGKDDGQSWGRFSGIAEEIMLALAMKKPVYVMGKAGGAGLAVGKLLGLDETLVNPDTCLADIGSIEHSPLYKHYRHAFVLPEQPNLPRTVAEVRNYLFEHGVTSSTWPWNGLTPEQNRQLFNIELTQEDEPKEQEDDLKENKRSCISLIIEGLTRLDWKKQSRNSQEPKAIGRANSAG